MKITLHVGPHKTGTTSIQSWMLENSKRHLKKHGVYYPRVDQFPPGHATVAWRALGLNKHQIDPLLLNKVVDEATDTGAKNLVLSSEEFCRGLTQGTLENLRALNERGSVDLVVTLTPLPNRFVAEVCEEIKHAVTFDLANVDFTEFCLRRPGLWPDFLQRLQDGICPVQTHVILGEKKYPNFLIESFAEILGIPSPHNHLQQNQRFPHSRTRLLNFVNAEFSDIAPKKRRELSGKLDAILQAEGLGNRARPIGFPDTVNNFLAAMWKLQLGHLQALGRSGEIELYRRATSATENNEPSDNPDEGQR